MSDFWNLSDGSSATETGKKFEVQGGAIEPIPDGTTCVAAIEEAAWREWEGERYISLKWRVMEPKDYSRRVVPQKVKVYEEDKGKADRARKMLAAIDENAGGGLPKDGGEPSSIDLMSALCGKPMAIGLKVWEINGNSGNWVCAVAPANGGQAKPVPASPISQDVPF